ncbi:hypothetical protein LF95_01785 [Thalassospira sp. TSL5-1]|nr:hypothetical protein LF95_01785 [Thalassospira sp. TSL5-1]
MAQAEYLLDKGEFFFRLCLFYGKLRPVRGDHIIIDDGQFWRAGDPGGGLLCSFYPEVGTVRCAKS